MAEENLRLEENLSQEEGNGNEPATQVWYEFSDYSNLMDFLLNRRSPLLPRVKETRSQVQVLVQEPDLGRRWNTWANIPASLSPSPSYPKRSQCFSVCLPTFCMMRKGQTIPTARLSWRGQQWRGRWGGGVQWETIQLQLKAEEEEDKHHGTDISGSRRKRTQ